METLDWEKPICDCPEPSSLPAGYEREVGGNQDVVCSAGYMGTPQKLCRPRLDANCAADPTYVGCSLVVPCGASSASADNDTREGLLTVSLTFGPASIGGVIDESAVRAYRVYFANECNQTLGKPVAVIDKQFGSPPTCCDMDYYAARLVMQQVPTGATQLLVLAQTASWESPVGRPVSFQDKVSFVAATAGALPILGRWWVNGFVVAAGACRALLT